MIFHFCSSSNKFIIVYTNWWSLSAHVVCFAYDLVKAECPNYHCNTTIRKRQNETIGTSYCYIFHCSPSLRWILVTWSIESQTVYIYDSNGMKINSLLKQCLIIPPLSIFVSPTPAISPYPTVFPNISSVLVNGW